MHVWYSVLSDSHQGASRALNAEVLMYLLARCFLTGPHEAALHRDDARSWHLLARGAFGASPAPAEMDALF